MEFRAAEVIMSDQFRSLLDLEFRWKEENIANLDCPVLIVLDYSPSCSQPPVSMAFDSECRSRCWLTVTTVVPVNDRCPNSYPDYRSFSFDNRTFHPYSVGAFPPTIFEDISVFRSACLNLYLHAAPRGGPPG